MVLLFLSFLRCGAFLPVFGRAFIKNVAHTHSCSQVKHHLAGQLRVIDGKLAVSFTRLFMQAAVRRIPYQDADHHSQNQDSRTHILYFFLPGDRQVSGFGGEAETLFVRTLFFRADKCRIDSILQFFLLVPQWCAHNKYHLFLEMLGYAISNLRPVKKAFVLLGPPSIGKSVVLELIARIVGEDAYTSATWATLVEKYYSALVVGATLVLSDEMPVKPLRHLDVLKSIISGSSIVVEKKFGEIQKYTPHVKLISAANCLPELGEPDAGGAFAERLSILRLGLDAPIEKDPDLIEALWEERDMLFSLAVKETKTLIERKMTFTEDPDGQVLCEQLRNSGNSVNSYIQSRYQKNPNGRVSIEDCYADYINFCDEEFWLAVAKAVFRRQVAQLGYSFQKLRVPGHTNPCRCIVGLTARKEEPECRNQAKFPPTSEQSESQS